MTQVKSVMQRRDRLFRAVAGTEYSVGRSCRRDLTSEEKRIARHLSHVGKSVEEIAKAIHWEQTVSSLQKKLSKINVKPRRGISLNCGWHHPFM